jgi:hypothetical protein
MEKVSLKTWNDFRSYVDEDPAIVPVYWRGQKDPSWPLASPYEREILSWFGGATKGASKVYPYDGRYLRDDKPTWEAGYYQTLRDRYIDAFRRGQRASRP